MPRSTVEDNRQHSLKAACEVIREAEHWSSPTGTVYGFWHCSNPPEAAKLLAAAKWLQKRK